MKNTLHIATKSAHCVEIARHTFESEGQDAVCHTITIRLNEAAALEIAQNGQISKIVIDLFALAENGKFLELREGSRRDLELEGTLG
jgi:hypothetical protein